MFDHGNKELQGIVVDAVVKGVMDGMNWEAMSELRARFGKFMVMVTGKPVAAMTVSQMKEVKN